MVIKVNVETVRRGKVRLNLPKNEAAWELYRAGLMQREPEVFAIDKEKTA